MELVTSGVGDLELKCAGMLIYNQCACRMGLKRMVEGLTNWLKYIEEHVGMSQKCLSIVLACETSDDQQP